MTIVDTESIETESVHSESVHSPERRQDLRRRAADFIDRVPKIVLTDEAFAARHRALRAVLWLHIPLVVVVAAYSTITSAHWMGSGGTATVSHDVSAHAIVTWIFVAAAILAGCLVPLMRSPRTQALMVSGGLLMCANALVHGSGGQTDMHFDFFVVLALISLYQDAAVFALAIAAVAFHHGVIGSIAPTMVYSSPQALAHPVWYALLHAAFVLAMSGAQVAYWTFTRKSEAALRASTAEASRLALVATYTDNAVVIADPDGVIEWVNQAFTTMTGYTRDEAIGRRRSDLLDCPEAVEERLADLFVDVHKGLDAEFETRDRHGRSYWLSLEVRPIVEDGAVVRLVGVERDVTARRASEEHEREASRRVAALAEALAAEKALLSGVISTIPHLVYWKDSSDRYAGANAAFLQWRGGLHESALLGRTEQEVNSATDLSVHLQAIEHEVSESGQAVIDRHLPVTGADGRPASLLLSVLPQPGIDGAAGGLIGVGADVTHLKDLEHQLAQAQRLESIGQLAAGIAHEINTPVQFVADNVRYVADSFAGLVPALRSLGQAPAPASRPEYAEFCAQVQASLAGIDLAFLADEVPMALEESLEGLTRIAQIVIAMKEFSHPGVSSAAADLNRAVETTAQVSRNEWKYLATLDLDLDPAVGLVNCHQGEVKQVVLNMIVNAAHAIQQRQAASDDQTPGTISIATSRTGDTVQITIADDGIGMDPATTQRVFDPFFTTKDVGKGTGQGLSLAHSTVVQKHNGTIVVDSVRGAGTTFTITLPAPRDLDLTRPLDGDAALRVQA